MRRAAAETPQKRVWQSPSVGDWQPLIAGWVDYLRKEFSAVGGKHHHHQRLSQQLGHKLSRSTCSLSEQRHQVDRDCTGRRKIRMLGWMDGRTDQ